MDPRLYHQLQMIEETHWWFRGRRAVLLAALRRSGIRGRRVLDCGCGAGSNVQVLGSVSPDAALYGVDIERVPLRFYHDERALPASQADASRLPFADGSFDLVSALDTIEHVEDDAAVLGELYRVCRPGGSLLLTVPAFEFMWGNIDESGHHFRRYSRGCLVERITEAGFEPRLVRFFNWLLFTPIAAVRLAARILPARVTSPGADVQTDFDLVKTGPVNAVLAALFSLEARLLALAPPFGVSLLVVAGKRGPTTPDATGSRSRSASEGGA